MLALNLMPIFKARGIERPYSYLVKAGFTSHSAHLILNSKSRVFRLDHIERLCKTLICEPNDLLVYVPNNDEHISEEHPLNNLRQTHEAKDMKATLATLPFKQLKEITKQIHTNTNTDNSM